MKERLYVRVARRPSGSWIGGSRYKIDAASKHNPRPLEQGDKLLRTLHFAIDVELPDAIFDDPMMPTVTLQLEPGSGYIVDPVIAQVKVAPPAGTRPACSCGSTEIIEQNGAGHYCGGCGIPC